MIEFKGNLTKTVIHFSRVNEVSAGHAWCQLLHHETGTVEPVVGGPQKQVDVQGVGGPNTDVFLLYSCRQL